MRQFKQDIFDETIPVETTTKKYCKMTKELETVYNVAYRNATCDVQGELRVEDNSTGKRRDHLEQHPAGAH